MRRFLDQDTLFGQIALRLATLALVFSLLDGAIVVAMYVNDDQALAEDFIEQQSGRVSHIIGPRHLSQFTAAELSNLQDPFGVTHWGVAVLDHNGRPAVQAFDPGGLGAAFWPSPQTLDWTRRELTSSGVRVSGLRRLTGADGGYWIMISADITDARPYWPVIGQEIVEHVALPLVPLTALLLLFNVQVVRRMLAPLTRAASEVDALDASRMESRLTLPNSSREVGVLVRAVNRALDRLGQSMSTLRDFTADAAHELRTPLSVLRLRIDTLPDSATKAQLSAEVQGMSRMVAQMLDLAQADSLSLGDASPVNLADIANEVITQVAPHAFRSGHEIRLIDLNSAPILGHADALARAVRNLTENAIHHTPPGTEIEVIVGPGAQLSVRDHGPGLAGTDMGRAFSRFWRKDRKGDGGAGLGLGIVRSIVEAHGGTVTVDTPSGGGARFVCTFPKFLASPRPTVDTTSPQLKGSP